MSKHLSVPRLPAAILCLAMLAACTTMGGPGLVQSQVSAELSADAASAIASDMADQLAAYVGPGTTTIALKGDDATLGPALETSLRNKGYAIVTDQETGGATVLPLAYAIDPFEGSVLVRVSTATVELTRMYAPSAAGATGVTGAEPASPLSIMQRGSAGAS